MVPPTNIKLDSHKELAHSTVHLTRERTSFYLPMLSLPESINIVSLLAVFINSLQEYNETHQSRELIVLKST